MLSENDIASDGTTNSIDLSDEYSTLERKIVWSRIVGAAALVAAWPVLTAARPLVGLAIVLAILVALAAVEVRARE